MELHGNTHRQKSRVVTWIGDSITKNNFGNTKVVDPADFHSICRTMVILEA